MSRIGKLPVPVPSGVDVTIDGQRRDRQGPEGLAVAHRRRADRGRAGRRRRRSLVTRPDDERASRSLHGLTRTLIANMVTGVTAGLREEARDRRHRLPRAGEGRGPRVRARLQPPDHGRAAGRASPSRSRPDQVLGVRASTSSRSARSRPTSASCASPTRTRARASGTRASRSGARSERLGRSNGDRHQAQRQGRGASRGRPRPSSPARAQEGRRHRRASAPRRDPLRPARLRPGRGRRRRPDAGRRPPRWRPTCARSTATRPPRPAGSASSSPSGRRRPGSSRGLRPRRQPATTAAWPRSPTAPARAG